MRITALIVFSMIFFGCSKKNSEPAPSVPEEVRTGSATDKLAYVYTDISDRLQPGVRTQDIEDRVEILLPHLKAEGYFKGYRGFPNFISASLNDEVLHTLPSSRRMKHGDILKLQVGLKSDGLHAYVGWTFPIGEITPADQRLLDIGPVALSAGSKKLRDGVAVSEVAAAMDTVIRKAGFEPNADYVGYRIGEYATMPPEIPCRFNLDRPPPGSLSQGMTVVLLVIIHAGSPQLRVAPDGWNLKTKDGSRSALFSGMYRIGSDDAENLTKRFGQQAHGVEHQVR